MFWRFLLGSAIFIGGMLAGGVCTLVTIALLSFDDDGVRYLVADNDSTATYKLDFPPDQLAARLDATGLFHGVRTGPFLSTEEGTLEVSMDNVCREAVVRISPLFNGTAVRLTELRATKDCRDQPTEAALREVFEEGVLGRLNGTLSALDDVSAVEGENFDYAPADAPSLVLSGSTEDFANRLDGNWLFAHEFHDGVYYLGPIACYGRFRVTEEPYGAHVVVTGIGFALPCFAGATQECLGRVFETFIRLPGDPTPSPAPTSATAPSFEMCLSAFD